MKQILFADRYGTPLSPKAHWDNWDGEVPQIGDMVHIVISEDTCFIGKVVERHICNLQPNQVRCFIDVEESY